MTIELAKTEQTKAKIEEKLANYFGVTPNDASIDQMYKAVSMSVVDIFRAKIVDYGTEAMTIEITGETSKIDAFVDLVKEFGIIEMCRTGIVSLQRGSESILSNTKAN